MPKKPLPKTSTRAVPPSESAANSKWPPDPPPVPLLIRTVAFPAAEVSQKVIPPAPAPLIPLPLHVKMLLAAVEALKNSRAAPFAPVMTPLLTVMLAFPAVESSQKMVKLAPTLVTEAPLLMMVALPADDDSRKLIN